MRLTIACRKSDLARLQAYTVGDALKRHFPDLNIEYTFRASLGDQNQGDPLWKMPSQGVFTQDFVADLVNGQVDMVVHSWKDLPVQNDGSTLLAATLKRADHRDLLLVKKNAVEQIKKRRSLNLLSSSPRRMYNLPGFLRRAFPGGLDSVHFDLVRGNIQTRLDKMFQSEADGLIVAKAAIDRLGSAFQFNQPNDIFDGVSHKIGEALNSCQWMVLPASHNPPAAAQGALVVEIAKERKDLADRLQAINCKTTFNDVTIERETLALYGGGCHQKIGVWVQTCKEGQVFCIRGETDAGETLNEFSLRDSGKPENTIPMGGEAAGKSQYTQSLPIHKNDGGIVWSRNVPDWFNLASSGIWVNGSDDSLDPNDSLGPSEDHRLEVLLNSVSGKLDTPRNKEDWLAPIHP